MTNETVSYEKRVREGGETPLPDREALFVFGTLRLSRHKDGPAARMGVIHRTAAGPSALCADIGPGTAKRRTSSCGEFFTTKLMPRALPVAFTHEPL